MIFIKNFKLKKKFILFYFISFNFLCYYCCSINLRRQSEHSGIRPDTSSLVYLSVDLSSIKSNHIIFKTYSKCCFIDMYFTACHFLARLEVDLNRKFHLNLMVQFCLASFKKLILQCEMAGLPTAH